MPIGSPVAGLELSNVFPVVSDLRSPAIAPVDVVLLDAPCTGSGVVRRHPDIRWLRRPSDIGRFCATQALMLDSLWRLLAGNGKVLYVTCSVFPEENGDQVRAFLERHPDARRLPLAGIDDGQILPSAANDGFYYALLSRLS